MQKHAYHLLDVFTDTRFGGNQLAVFLDGHLIPENRMQVLARELNLSETVFVFPPDDPNNHFKLRIFTPAMELPMAGHPTVGTAYLLHQEGKLAAGHARLEEKVGVIPVMIADSGAVKMTQPRPEFGQVIENRTLAADLLSLAESELHPDYPVQPVSSGVPFTLIPIKDLAAIRKIKLRQDVWEQHFKNSSAPHIFVFTPETENPQASVHSRMFAPAMGISEDPATGAASGPLGAYLVQYGLVKAENALHILSEQGIEAGRPSAIQIEVDVEGENITGVRIGGESVYIGAGFIQF